MTEFAYQDEEGREGEGEGEGKQMADCGESLNNAGWTSGMSEVQRRMVYFGASERSGRWLVGACRVQWEEDEQRRGWLTRALE